MCWRTAWSGTFHISRLESNSGMVVSKGKQNEPASCSFLAWLFLRTRICRRHVPPKRRLTFNRLHDVISQKTELLHSGEPHSTVTCTLPPLVILKRMSHELNLRLPEWEPSFWPPERMTWSGRKYIRVTQESTIYTFILMFWPFLTYFNTLQLLILPTEHICMLRIVLTTNRFFA
jgi:hypothetical protein